MLTRLKTALFLSAWIGLGLTALPAHADINVSKVEAGPEEVTRLEVSTDSPFFANGYSFDLRVFKSPSNAPDPVFHPNDGLIEAPRLPGAKAVMWRPHPANPRLYSIRVTASNEPNADPKLLSLPVTVPREAPVGAVYTFRVSRFIVETPGNHWPLRTDYRDGSLTVVNRKPQIALSHASGGPGDTVTLTLRAVGEVKGVSGIQFNLIYDPALTLLREGFAPDALVQGQVVANSPYPGLLKVAMASADKADGPGVVAHIPFRLPAVAARTAFRVGISDMVIVDSQVGARTLPAGAGSITVDPERKAPPLPALALKGSVSQGESGQAARQTLYITGEVRDLTRLTFEVKFDTALSASAGDVTPASPEVQGLTVEAGPPGVLRVDYAPPAPRSGPFPLLGIDFRLPMLATTTEYPVGITLLEARSGGEALRVAASEGTVRVVSPTPLPALAVPAFPAVTGTAGATVAFPLLALEGVRDVNELEFDLILPSGVTYLPHLTEPSPLIDSISSTLLQPDRYQMRMRRRSNDPWSGPDRLATFTVQLPNSFPAGAPVELRFGNVRLLRGADLLAGSDYAVPITVLPSVLSALSFTDSRSTPGKDATLTLSIDTQGFPVSGLQFQLLYDSSLITQPDFVTLEPGWTVGPNGITRTGDGGLEFHLVRPAPSAVKGELFKVRFRLPALQKRKTFTVRLVNGSLITLNGFIQVSPTRTSFLALPIAGNPSPSASAVNLESRSVAPGGTVLLALRKTPFFPDVTRLKFNLAFPPELYAKAEDVSRGDVDEGMLKVLDNATGKLHFDLASETSLNESGILAQVAIRIPSDAPVGSVYPIAVTDQVIQYREGTVRPADQTVNIRVAEPSSSVAANLGISASNVSAPPGGTATVSINASERTKSVTGIQFDLKYDPALGVRLDEVTPGSLVSGSLAMNLPEPGTFKFAVASPHASDGPGRVVGVPMHIPADAPVGTEYPIRVSDLYLFGYPRTGDFHGGKITVRPGPTPEQALEGASLSVLPARGWRSETVRLQIRGNEALQNLTGYSFRVVVTKPSETAPDLAYAHPSGGGSLFPDAHPWVDDTKRGEFGAAHRSAVHGSGPGTVLELPVKVPADAARGSVYTLEIRDVELTVNGARYTASTLPGTLTVEGRRKGDVRNLDGGDAGDDQLDVTDVVELLRILVSLHPPTADQRYAADTDCNGAVELPDAIKLLKMILYLDASCS